jgi:hypothetical protein
MAANTLANLGEIREYVTWLLEQDVGGTSTDTVFWTNNMLNAWISAEHDNVVTTINENYEEFFTDIATTDIVANAEIYQLPNDFRQVQRLEYTATPSSGDWKQIEPIQVNDKGRYFVRDGISPAGESRGHRVTYYFQGNNYILTPYFNSGAAGGMRLHYTKRLTRPVDVDGNWDDAWVPFDGLLLDHHEVLAMGCMVRARMREEIDHGRYVGMYDTLLKRILDFTDKRQVQRSKMVRDTSPYYGESDAT